MATSTSMHHLMLFACTLLLLLLHLTATVSAATQPPRPKALVIPTTKDTKTLQYIIKLNHRTPPVSTPLTIDLKSTIPWTICNSACTKSDCPLTFTSPFDPKSTTTGKLVSETVRINSTNGANVGRIVSAPNFKIGCAKNRVKGLAKGVKGIAAYGRSKSKLSLPDQFSSKFGFSDKFALCLNSNWTTGVAFFGPGRPYRLYPGPEDITSLFSYTPLIVNPKNPSEYFITVSNIIVNLTTIPITKSILKIDPKTGSGGTKISTTAPYSVFRTPIYNSITTAFDSELRKYSMTQVKRVDPVAPFTVCYDINTLVFTRIGVVVPDIKLVLDNPKVVWTIFGTNSMVGVGGDAICLGFVDGGVDAKEGIVIGGYQIENNLLEFDLGVNRLGFTSSLQYKGFTTCGNFNFTLV